MKTTSQTPNESIRHVLEPSTDMARERSCSANVHSATTTIYDIPAELKSKFVACLPRNERARAVAVLRLNPFDVVYHLPCEEHDALLRNPLSTFTLEKEMTSLLAKRHSGGSNMAPSESWMARRAPFLVRGGTAQRYAIDVALSGFERRVGTGMLTPPSSPRRGKNRERQLYTHPQPRQGMDVLTFLVQGLSGANGYADRDQIRILRSIKREAQSTLFPAEGPLTASAWRSIVGNLRTGIVAGAIAMQHRDYAIDLLCDLSKCVASEEVDAFISSILEANAKSQLSADAFPHALLLIGKLTAGSKTCSISLPVARSVLYRVLLTPDVALQGEVLRVLEALCKKIPSDSVDEIIHPILSAIADRKIDPLNIGAAIDLIRALLPDLSDDDAGDAFQALSLAFCNSNLPDHIHQKALMLFIDLSIAKALPSEAVDNSIEHLSEALCRGLVSPASQAIGFNLISGHASNLSSESAEAVVERLYDALNHHQVDSQHRSLVHQIIGVIYENRA